MKRHTLPRRERLRSLNEIKRLFSKAGTTAFAYPFKVFYLPKEGKADSAMPQVLFSVPKRQFKRAVDRNLIRRRSKEAYRLQKPAGADVFARAIGFMYVGKVIEPYPVIANGMRKALKQLVRPPHSDAADK